MRAGILLHGSPGRWFARMLANLQYAAPIERMRTRRDVPNDWAERWRLPTALRHDHSVPDRTNVLWLGGRGVLPEQLQLRVSREAGTGEFGSLIRGLPALVVARGSACETAGGRVPLSGMITNFCVQGF